MVRNFFITFIVFMGIDLIWLGIVARKTYVKYLGFIMRSPPNWIAAIIFYIIFIIGLMFFALYPALSRESLGYAILVGAFFRIYNVWDL